MSLDPGTLVGPYRLGRLLGRGGMAVVYEATHETMGRTVALKLVAPDRADPEFAARLGHEGQMQAALDHPNVVAVYEAGSSEHGPYLAMRLIRGPTLAALIDEAELTTARTLEIVGEVAAALDAAHAAGLVHRDVKPRNVLVDADGRAYLADFGLTRRGDGGGRAATGSFMGTIAYAAPEVVTGEAGGPAADRYALAALLFECLTGTPVFPRPTHAAVLFAHASEPPPRVSGRREGVPPALDAVFHAGLAKEPADRPARAADLVADARVALAGVELGPPPRRSPGPVDATTAGTPTIAPPLGTARRGAGRRRAGLALAAAAGALVAAVGVLALDGSEPSPAASAAAAGLPAAPAGSVLLGDDLAAPGATRGCDGQTVAAGAPGCTVFQERVAGQTLVVPDTGVVRRWGVRSASGEFALVVLRPRGDGYLQINRSPPEFVEDGGAHLFATDMAVDKGDRLGLVVVDGSGVGLRPTSGATQRWIPQLKGIEAAPEDGPPGTLLLRVDYVPGARRDAPRRLTGRAAAAAPAGRLVVERRRGAVQVRVVSLGAGGGAVDLVRRGRRVSRVQLDDLRAPVADDATLLLSRTGRGLSAYLTFRRAESDRLLHHYLLAFDRRLVFVN